MKDSMSRSKEFKDYDSFQTKDYDYLQTAAVQDCTGLIPVAPQNETERDNYEELYPVLPRVTLKNDINYVED